MRDEKDLVLEFLNPSLPEPADAIAEVSLGEFLRELGLTAEDCRRALEEEVA